MEIRLFEYALELARQGNFTRAAQKLRVAQPSLSQQIMKLERELGVTLFNRDRGAVRPTPDGLRFLEQAEQIVRMRDDLRREMEERRTGVGRELVVGAPAITGGRVLPRLLREFRMRHPAVRVRLIEETTERLEELTARGQADLSILALPLADSRLAVRPLLTEPLYLAIPPSGAGPDLDWLPEEALGDVESSGPLPISGFSRAPFILLKPGYGFRNTVLGMCAEAGFQPSVAFETGSIETAQSLAAHGLGVTVAPAMVRRRFGPAPRYVSISGGPTRTLVFAHRRDRYLSRGAESLIATWEEVMRDPLARQEVSAGW